MVYMSAIIGTAGMMWVPLFQALVANQVHKDEQGMLQGLIKSIEGAGGAIGTQLFGILVRSSNNDALQR